MESINKVIKEVKEKYAPDKRVALFNIEVKEENEVLSLEGETNLPAAKKELNALLRKEGLQVKDNIETLPTEDFREKCFGIVNVSVVSIRSYPKHSAELATQALLGAVVNVFKKDGGFYLVQTPDMYISWADNDGIHLVTEEEKNEWITSKRVIYLKEYGFSYSKPDVNSDRISDLAIGNIFKFVSADSQFCKVQYPCGKKAFIPVEECMDLDKWADSQNPTPESVLEMAKKFNGVPYMWGGTSSKLLDCSGFTKTVYFMHGIILDRDASQQVHKGELVDTENGFENLQKGDLLFFGTKATEDKKERITHVGIYIEDGDFIHEGGTVKINSFNKEKPYYSEYRTNTFIRARRVLSSIGKNGIQTIKQNKFYYGE